MDINALKTFVEVAKTRHFAKAADNLFVSQSTVSARIRTLEELLGVSLFIRQRGNIQLSLEGEAFITHAQSMMKLWTRAQQEIGSGKGVRTTLSIGGLPGLWDISLHKWLARIRQTHPKLGISADIFGPKTLVNQVIDDSLDIAFLYDAPHRRILVAHPLPSIDLIRVSAKQYASLPSDWLHDLLHVDWGLSFAAQFAAEFPDAANARLKTSIGRIAHQQLLSGSGIAYLAKPVVQEDIVDKVLFKVPKTPTFKRRAHAIYHSNSTKTELIKELLELL